MTPAKKSKAAAPTTTVDYLSMCSFQKVMVSVAQKGCCRFEICAMVTTSEGLAKRMHVLTLHANSWGPTWEACGLKCAEHCRSTGATKASALKFRDSLPIG